MKVQSFYDETTGTFSYLIVDEKTRQCAVIDPVLNYDHDSGVVSEKSIDELKAVIAKDDLTVEWILETHAHADHLSGAYYLKQAVGGKIGIGEHIKEVLAHWVPIFDNELDTPLDGSQFDRLFQDGEQFTIGSLSVKVIHTPGHTPGCVSYLIDNKIFVGDTLLPPAIGTARTDFPGGSAEKLYESIQNILSLPENTEVYICHDYPEGDTRPHAMATVAEHKKKNVMVGNGIEKSTYVRTRQEKDSGKAQPVLLLPSLQVNIRAGYLGKASKNQRQYIKIPINLLKK